MPDHRTRWALILSVVLIVSLAVVIFTDHGSNEEPLPVSAAAILPVPRSFVAEARASRSEERPLLVAPAGTTTSTTVTTTVRSTSTTVRPVTTTRPLSTGGSMWGCIRSRESGNDYSRRSGNGYYGAYQFLPATWNAVMRKLGGGYLKYANGRADLAPPAVQDAGAQRLLQMSGWNQWPNTSKACGAR